MTNEEEGTGSPVVVSLSVDKSMDRIYTPK